MTHVSMLCSHTRKGEDQQRDALQTAHGPATGER